MALWQYTFHVLTKESFDLLSENFDLNFGELGFDDGPFWNFKPVHKASFEDVNLILERSISWCKQIDLYGDQESNCFEVLFDEKTNLVTSVSFRIDFTSNYSIVLRNIIEFCILNELVILDEQLRAVMPDYVIIKSLLDNSVQMDLYKQIVSKA